MLAPSPEIDDGVGQYTKDLCSYLSERTEIHHVPFPSSVNPAGYFRPLLSVAKSESDIIHVQHGYVLFGPASVMSWLFFPCIFLLSRFGNQRVVVTVHEALNPGLVAPPLRTAKGVYIRLVNHLLVATSDQLVFLAEHAKDRFSAEVSDAVVFPHGANTVATSPYSMPEAKELFGYEESSTLIVEPGYVSRRKGSHLFARLAKELPEYEFLLAGGASDEKHDRFVEKLTADAPENLRISGLLDEDRFRAAFAAADVVVLPYLEQTQSGIINKVNQSGIFNWCAAHSCVVVASQNEYFEQLASEWGCLRLAAPEDTEEMSATIRRILSDKSERAELTEQMLEFREANSFRRVAELHTEMYRDVCC